MNADPKAKFLPDQEVGSGRGGRSDFAQLQFATAQGHPAEKFDSGVDQTFKEACAMSGIFLFITPAIAALGALASLGLFVQALNAAKTTQARVRVAARRTRSH